MKSILFLIFLLFNFLSYSQVRVAIKLKNNEEIKDSVKQIGERLISLKTNKKYKLNDVNEITVFNKNSMKHYYILDVKLDKNAKQIQKGLGTKVYSKGDVELYLILFDFNIKNKHYFQRKIYNSKTEIFIKRKNSRYTYNIGCIDGLGCKTIKKRLYSFFSDCPSLLQMIKKNELKERDLIKIIDYYHESCNN
jgi:hypothetical protein